MNKFFYLPLFLHLENYSEKLRIYFQLVWIKKVKCYICDTFFMKRNRKIYNSTQLASAIFMIIALLWLTISTPFVNAAAQKIAEQDKITNSTNSPFTGNEEKSANPFGNTTEEKAPTNISFSEEYLHDSHTIDHFFSILLRLHKFEDADNYVAFHGELLVPPPNQA